jgi:hypothetical protein
MTILDRVRSSVTDSTEGQSDATLQARLEALHDHLEATAAMPIDPRTNRWLGEAEAVARDAARNEIEPATARERVRQIQHLLSEADEPDHDEAADHLAATRELCSDVLSE